MDKINVGELLGKSVDLQLQASEVVESSDGNFIEYILRKEVEEE